MPQSYDGDYIGHTISIVGWNDNLNRYRFSNGTGVLPQNNGAWLVRNSWGDNNTMGGYFWLSYEDKYIFGEKYSPNFTIDEVTEITDDMTLLQDERYRCYIQSLIMLTATTLHSSIALILAKTAVHLIRCFLKQRATVRIMRFTTFP